MRYAQTGLVNNLHATGNITSGLLGFSASGDTATRSSSSSNSVPPCPTNSLTVRVRAGQLTLAFTRDFSSRTVIVLATASPACNSTPLPNASIATSRSCSSVESAWSLAGTAAPSHSSSASEQLLGDCWSWFDVASSSVQLATPSACSFSAPVVADWLRSAIAFEIVKWPSSLSWVSHTFAEQWERARHSKRNRQQAENNRTFKGFQKRMRQLVDNHEKHFSSEPRQQRTTLATRTQRSSFVPSRQL